MAEPGAVFHPARMMGGGLFETEPDRRVEFSDENGVATGFRLRHGLPGRAICEGTRVD